MTSTRSIVALTLVTALTPPAIAQVAFKPINQTGLERGSNPDQFIPLNGGAVFTAEQQNLGRELYFTSAAGEPAVLVKDIYPGFESSNPRHLTLVGNEVFFVADDGVTGPELWKTDGTAAGTVQVLDIEPGPAGSGGSFFHAMGATLLLFQASGGGQSGLWRSDGTEAGTFFLSSEGIDSSAATLSGALMYESGGTDHELWRTDGTVQGTSLVKQIAQVAGTGGSNPSSLVVMNDVLFFSADDGVIGNELWSSDGTTAGTVLVKDIMPGAGTGLAPTSKLLVARARLFFQGNGGAAEGSELWMSDGTTAGTTLLLDINPGASSSSPSLFANINPGNAVFVADDGVTGRELWFTDGTVAGTVQVRDLRPGPISGLANTTEVVSFGHHAVFSGNDGIHGEELWRSNGTFPGTWLVRSIQVGGNSFPHNIAVDQPRQRAYLAADDGVIGVEPWWTDGWSPPFTNPVSNIETNPVGGSAGVGEIVDAFGTTFFRANDGVLGSELWKLDAQRNPVLVKDIAPGDPSSSPTGLTLFGGSLYFSANDGVAGAELWTTDGTTAGTVMVHDIAPGPGASNPTDFAVAGAWLYFVADDKTSGRELWRTDGTSAGTTRVADLEPGLPGSAAEFLTAVGDQIYFRAQTLATGFELWRSDGTQAGTVLVKDIVPGAIGSGPLQLTAVGSNLFFSAQQAASGRELYVTDGSASGTVLVKDIRAGTGNSDPVQLRAFDGRLLFAANDGVSGEELWTSDGTNAGTTMVLDIAPGAASSSPKHLTVSSAWVAFSAAGQLWRTDGTPGETISITAAPTVTGMWRAGSRHVYWSGTGFSITDGTAAGSRLVYTRWLHASQVALSGGRLVFAGAHPTVGVAQLLSVDPGATAQTVGVSCGAPGSAPTLRSGDPVLGSVVGVGGDGAPAGAVGFVLFDGARPPLAIAPAPCAIYINSLAVLATFPVVTPTWSVPIPLPNIAVLSGLRIGLQSVFGPTGATLGADLTNGVVWTLGY